MSVSVSVCRVTLLNIGTSLFCLGILLAIDGYAAGQNALEPFLQRCCSTGTSWAQNHSTCTGPPELLRQNHKGCITSFYVCCVRAHRQISCENGKNAAKTKGSCTSLPGHGGMTFKDCCDACALGIEASEMRGGCSFLQLSFGSPWDEAYQDCCQNPSVVQPTFPNSTLTCESRSCSQKCEQVGNQIECSCYVGYKLADNMKTCVDIDECQFANNPCNSENEICVNVVGGFECKQRSVQRVVQCPVGYVFNSEKRTCDDVDECQMNPCDRNQDCFNTKGSFACVSKNATVPCLQGFRIQRETGRCVDIDECSEGIDDCDRTLQICQNSHGAFECLNKPSGREKQKCPAGFKFNEQVQVCDDVDECSEKLDDCQSPDYICRNTMGAYDCDPTCPFNQRFDLQQGKCISDSLPQDAGSSSSCASQNTCKVDEVCIERSGFAECVSKLPDNSCFPGFKPTNSADGSKHSCTDVNECEEYPDICDPVIEICKNYEGSYECLPLVKQCPYGFHLDQTTKACTDVNECAEKLDNCDPINFYCQNTNGSFECVKKSDIHTCPPGYRYSSGSSKCEDIDECLEGRHKCQPEKEVCQNVAGAYMCQQLTPSRPCDIGRRYNIDTGSCEDINECSDGTHTCDLATQECINDIGSYRCTPKINCPYGFRWNNMRRKCDDVNECFEGIDDCDRRTHTCVNTVGSFQCQSRRPLTQSSCGIGFAYEAVSDTCKDINECEILRPCQEDQICENTQGSYRCICRQGFILDVTGKCDDVNECQLNLHDCSHSQRCDNTIGSFTCVRLTGCGTGYTLNAARSECEDDDECILGTHNCGPGFACRNTAGSFRCDRVQCPPGQKLLSDGTCKIITCGQGMEHDDLGNCIDINECARSQVCRLNQRCINTVGSFRCQNLLTCTAGYELNELGDGCEDVDECTRGIHECGPNQTCKNRLGGYICECPRGYALNYQRLCEDVDECSRFRGQVCASNSECINTQGSYTCNCNDGFRSGGSDKSCVDVDECAETPNICHQTCNNIWGSYQCSCKLGYTLAADQRTCEDINECEVYGSAGNLCIGFCVNEPGSFKCSCPPGYRLSSDGRTCQDIDECQEADICNDAQAVCLNTRGSYRCNRIQCPPNYIRDKEHKNRCKRSRDCSRGNPSSASECLKEPISYSYNYITFVSKFRMPLSGHVDLFTMRGPRFQSTTVQFDLELKDVRAPQDISPHADLNFFRLRRVSYNEAMVSLVKAIPGPQEIELDLIMKIYHNGLFGGKAIANIFIYVTEYEF